MRRAAIYLNTSVLDLYDRIQQQGESCWLAWATVADHAEREARAMRRRANQPPEKKT